MSGPLKTLLTRMDGRKHLLREEGEFSNKFYSFQHVCVCVSNVFVSQGVPNSTTLGWLGRNEE